MGQGTSADKKIKATRLGRSGMEPAGAGSGPLSARSMPESLAAEAAVLGSMIIDPGVLGRW